MNRSLVLAMSLTGLLGVSVAVFAQSDDDRALGSGWVAEREIDTSLEEIMSSPEFRYLVRRDSKDEPDEKKTGKTEKKPRRSESDDDSESRPDGGVGTGFESVWRALAYGALIVVAIAILAFIWLSITERNRLRNRPKARVDPRADEHWQFVEDIHRSPTESPWEALLGQGKEQAAKGDFAMAITTLLFGSMSWAESGGWIRYRVGLTNRDYVRALRGDRVARDAFATIARTFEEVVFGRREATPERYQACLVAFERGLRRSQATMGHHPRGGGHVVSQ